MQVRLVRVVVGAQIRRAKNLGLYKAAGMFCGTRFSAFAFGYIPRRSRKAEVAGALGRDQRRWARPLSVDPPPRVKCSR